MVFIGTPDVTTDSRAPRCLVLLASHNGAEYIQQQLESILAQREVAVEVLIGDDASSDTTLQIIESLNRKDNLRVLRREVGSGSAAQNFARLFREVDATGFDYIALSDQDDIWLPNKLQRAISMLSASDAGGYSCSVIARWPGGKESVFRQSARLSDADFLFEGAGQGCTFVITGLLFNSVQRVFRSFADLTAQLIYHDWAVYALARALGITWYFDAEPFLVYRQHDRNDTGARHSLAGIKRRIQLFRNGGYAGQVSAICGLCLVVAPQNPLLHKWVALDSRTSNVVRRIGKAVFCFDHGRRRQFDRVLTATAALAGWL